MGGFEKIKRFLLSIGEFLEALIKIVLQSKFNLKLPEKNGDEIAYFANGPSLNETIKKLESEGLPSNIMVSNFFCESDYFKILKPNHYIICDPNFFNENYPGKKKVEEFYITLFKVDWEINFFVPYMFKKRLSTLLKQLNLDSNCVKVFYYNSVNFNGNSNVLLHLFKTRLGIPKPITVAVPALMECMHIGYTKIKIGGIDLNHHNCISVSKDNKVSFVHKHFYDKEKEERDDDSTSEENSVEFSVSELFLIFYNFFRSFDIVSRYAKLNNVEILNYSEHSYLDQFKKI